MDCGGCDRRRTKNDAAVAEVAGCRLQVAGLNVVQRKRIALSGPLLVRATWLNKGRVA